MVVAVARSRSMKPGVDRVVEHPRQLPVEELGLREALERVVQPPLQIGVRERQRPVLRNRRRKHAELLVAEHVAERHRRAAEDVAAARDADGHRRPAVEEHLLELALLVDLVGEQAVRQRCLEVDHRSGRAEVGRGRGDDRVAALERVQFVVALVVADERHLRRIVAAVQQDGRGVAAHRVGELAQLAVLEAQRPDVVDGAVAGDVGVDRLRRVGGRRREDDRVLIHELRRRVVVRAERDLRLLQVSMSSLNSFSLPLTRAT